MIKNTLLATMLASAAFAAHADVTRVVIDDFNAGDQSLSFDQSNAIGTTLSNTNSIRTLTSTLLCETPPVQAVAQVNSGMLDITNVSGENTTVIVKWNLAANLLPASAFDTMFSMEVINSDANPTSMVFDLDGHTIGSYSLPGNVANHVLDFDLGGFDLGDGGVLTMTLNGAEGWDMTLDSLGISYDTPAQTVPEPASLALVGDLPAGPRGRASRQAALIRP